MKTYSSIPSSKDGSESTASYWRMFVLGLIVIAPTIFNGVMLVYPAVAMPQMNLSIADATWFASISPITAPIGSILIGFIIDKLGRRSALLFSVCPTLLGWTFLSWDYSLAVILIGQALNGVSSGCLTYPAQVYAGECIMVNHIRWRDNYLSWLGMGSALGMCFTLLLAYFIQYRTIATISAAMSVVTFLLIYTFIPESPHWLFHEGRYGDAEWSQSKLGISQPIMRGHASAGTANREETPLTAGKSISTAPLLSWSSIKTYADKSRRKDVYKPLLIMIGVFVLLTFCGAVNVMVYLVNVIGENDVIVNATAPANVTLDASAVSHIRLSNSYKYSAISGILILIANCIVCAIVGHVGVKKILCAAALCIAFGFSVLGYTTTRAADVADVFTWHIAAVWIIIFAFNFGVMNLPNSVLGNIFPADAKGYASIVCVFEFLMTAFLIKIHPYMRIEFGGALYYGYSWVALIAAVYVALFMVETVGKTADEIRNEFMK